MLSSAQVQQFQTTVWKFYEDNKRDFPWRQTTDPYAILVSEVMLQQTQASRVVSYYQRFLGELPNFTALADCPTDKLLKLWQGLGYNRRALYLRDAARKIVNEHSGVLPKDTAILTALSGIGRNTAGSLIAFAYNLPTVFLETNIRKVYIHHFFPETDKVSDRELLPTIEQTLVVDQPRQWYYALMDYGAWLGQTKVVKNERSRHYHRQSAFEGSNRQVRSLLLRQLLKEPQHLEKLAKSIDVSSESLARNLDDLVQEGFVIKHDKVFSISPR